MSCEEHSFINENGFKCCTSCGIALTEMYWDNEHKKHEFGLRQRAIVMSNYTHNTHWRRLLRLNNNSNAIMPSFIYKEVLAILNLLPIAPTLKRDFHTYITNMKIKSYDELCKVFYDLVCKHDLPITTADFIKTLRTGRKHDYKLLTKLKSVEYIRKYYWYINKLMHKAKELLNLSNEETQHIYKIVFNYYNLIRFRMYKSSNPVYLIQNLIYYTIREVQHPNQKVFNKYVFGLTNLSYITTLVRYLKEIRVKKLDACFTNKLSIGKRNIRLASTI